MFDICPKMQEHLNPQAVIDHIAAKNYINSLDCDLWELHASHKLRRNKDLYVKGNNESFLLGKGLLRGNAIVTGDYVEVCLYASPLMSGFPSECAEMGSHLPESQEERERKSALRSTKRAEKNIRRLVNHNNLKMMYTLTMALSEREGGKEGNSEKYKCIPHTVQSDYAGVKEAFRLFRKRFDRVFPEAKWLVVYELHNSRKTSECKRGTWHLHLACDTDISQSTMFGIWQHGFVGRDDFSKPKKGVREGKVRNPGAYMSKYIGKNFDASNKYLKRYSRSRNMSVPKRITLDTFFDSVFPRCQEVVYKSEREIKSENSNISLKQVNITYKLKEKTYE